MKRSGAHCALGRLVWDVPRVYAALHSFNRRSALFSHSLQHQPPVAGPLAIGSTQSEAERQSPSDHHWSCVRWGSTPSSRRPLHSASMQWKAIAGQSALKTPQPARILSACTGALSLMTATTPSAAPRWASLQSAMYRVSIRTTIQSLSRPIKLQSEEPPGAQTPGSTAPTCGSPCLGNARLV